MFNKVYGDDVQSPAVFRENRKLWNLHLIWSQILKILNSSNRSYKIYWTKKKERYNFGGITFLNSCWKWIYGILLTAIFHIRLYNKFCDQSSVTALIRQWVKFQKVRGGRILTTKISMCVDRRYFYFSLTGQSQNVEQIRIHLNARVSKRW